MVLNDENIQTLKNLNYRYCVQSSSRKIRMRSVGSSLPGAKLYTIPASAKYDIKNIDLFETVKQHVLSTRRLGPPIDINFIRIPVKNVRSRVLNVLILDASGSMNFLRRISTAKGVLQEIVKRSYIERCYVSLIVARGAHAEILAGPTRCYEAVFNILSELPSGGATPLAHALYLAEVLVKRWKMRVPRSYVRVLIVTDGKANVSLYQDPVDDVVELVQRLVRIGADVVVYDTRTGPGIELSRNCIDELRGLGIRIVRV